MLLPPALGSSPHPPVSVYGTGTHKAIAAFLGTSPARFGTLVPYASRFRVRQTVFPFCPLWRLPHDPVRGGASDMRPRSSVSVWYRNLNLLSIGYAFRPPLRSRLTQGRSASPWKPWIFGRMDSHHALATHSGILSSHTSTALFSTASPIWQCSPTSPDLSWLLSFGDAFSPGHFRRRDSRLVSYYALFECVAASEPTS